MDLSSIFSSALRSARGAINSGAFGSPIDQLDRQVANVPMPQTPTGFGRPGHEAAAGIVAALLNGLDPHHRAGTEAYSSFRGALKGVQAAKYQDSIQARQQAVQRAAARRERLTTDEKGGPDRQVQLAMQMISGMQPEAFQSFWGLYGKNPTVQAAVGALRQQDPYRWAAWPEDRSSTRLPISYP
jgi:hypothetical protein